MNALAATNLDIDADHHLWRYSAAEYAWIDGSMAALRRDFLPEETGRSALATDPKLVGLRHIVQAELKGFRDGGGRSAITLRTSAMTSALRS